MAYLRESQRYDAGLPSIHSHHRDRPTSATLLDRRVPPAVIDDPLLDDRVGRYGPQRERDALFYPRPPSPTHTPICRKQNMDLQEQNRFYRDELAKKDRLIAQLSSADTPRPKTFDTVQIEEMYANERLTASAAAKSEIAALRVKVDGLNSQMRELQSQLDSRDDRLRDLKLQVETARENEAKQVALTQSIRQKLVEYEAQYGSLEGAANRSEITITTLQHENQVAKDRIMELESRVRTHMEERERAEQERGLLEKRFQDFITQAAGYLRPEDTGIFSASDPELVFSKVMEMMRENSLLRGKMATMKEYVQNAEMENKASRETIMRLVSEAEREQSSVSRFNLEMDNLRMEKTNAEAKQRELEREIELLKDRLDSSQRAWTATRRELEEREAHFSTVDREVRNHELQARNSENQYKTFKESIASLLSECYQPVEPYEEAIREKIKMLMLTTKDRSSHGELLEGKVGNLTEQLERQYELQRVADRKAKRAEADLLDLQDRLHRAENDLAAGDVLRDGMRVDKERYLRFIERVMSAMKMEPLAADMGMDMATDAIVARAEQLVNMEMDSLADRKTHIYNLQRKVKSQKEQLESKELHMDLLRKKVATLEERLVNKSELEREKDEGFVKNRKLLNLVERYKRELNEARLEITSLKAQLLEGSEYRSRTLEQERELENLESKVGQLEHVRQRQAQKISTLKEEMGSKEEAIASKRDQINNTVQGLTSELRTTKQALEEITQREKQLLDLRQVIARMLGLDVNTLAVPDYEIIARLEKLILANHSNASTAFALDNVITDMEEGFRAGYRDATRTLAASTAAATAPVPHAPRVSQRMHSRTRSRSLSPTHRRDPKAY